MLTISTAIDIAATPERVWDIIVGFDDYERWNPFIVHAAGRAEEGSTLSIRVLPPGKTAMTFRPKVLVAITARKLAWSGRFLLTSLFEGRHELRIESRGAHCTFHHSEAFVGLLAPIFAKTSMQATTRGFEAMNQALKRRAESPTAEEA